MLYSLAGLVGGIVALACLVGYVPPYSWVADAQLSLTGTNFVAVSYMVTFLVTSAPFVLLVRVFHGRLDPDGTLERKVFKWDAFLDTWPGKSILIGATVAIAGGYLGYRDATRGPLTDADVGALERGEDPRGTYVTLTNAGAVDAGRIDFRENSSTSTYVPIVSRADRSTAAVFARYRDGIDRGSPLTGTLDRNDLPGEIRSAYEGAGVIASPHWVLDVGADPAERARFSVWMVAFGLVVVAVGIPGAVAASRRR
ncbi:hypothetical protein [Nannocystis punicea]|uniref:Cytochrome c-type biogenesis protein CcmF C-terminal domain-containing protein n=1 Tax=Nannocystis punicea TaxID=2995304 RepID=A0ABY7GZM0_9BACT|nr:hypothetical protein [Nannocystis poenicansa]WAS92459.1 hypothetical protein O0S08_40285 [Nannocystis poenicansa]